MYIILKHRRPHWWINVELSAQYGFFHRRSWWNTKRTCQHLACREVLNPSKNRNKFLHVWDFGVVVIYCSLLTLASQSLSASVSVLERTFSLLTLYVSVAGFALSGSLLQQRARMTFSVLVTTPFPLCTLSEFRAFVLLKLVVARSVAFVYISLDRLS